MEVFKVFYEDDSLDFISVSCHIGVNCKTSSYGDLTKCFLFVALRDNYYFYGIGGKLDDGSQPSG